MAWLYRDFLGSDPLGDMEKEMARMDAAINDVFHRRARPLEPDFHFARVANL